MSTSPVRISIITAALNRVHTVRDTLDSVMAQTYPHLEYVFVDGGSTDGTLKLVQECGCVDHLSSEPDEGIYDALNKGIRLATGDIIGFLHADDVLATPEALTRIAEAFEDQGVMAVYGDLEYVRRNDITFVIRHWRAGGFEPRKLAHGWMPPHPTVYVRRGVYEALGGYDTRYRIASDYKFLLQLLRDPAYAVRYLPFTLVRMRIGGMSNHSLKNVLQKSREDLHILRSLGMGGSTLIWKNLTKFIQIKWWNVLLRFIPVASPTKKPQP